MSVPRKRAPAMARILLRTMEKALLSQARLPRRRRHDLSRGQLLPRAPVPRATAIARCCEDPDFLRQFEENERLRESADRASTAQRMAAIRSRPRPARCALYQPAAASISS